MQNFFKLFTCTGNGSNSIFCRGSGVLQRNTEKVNQGDESPLTVGLKIGVSNHDGQKL